MVCRTRLTPAGVLSRTAPPTSAAPPLSRTAPPTSATRRRWRPRSTSAALPLSRTAPPASATLPLGALMLALGCHGSGPAEERPAASPPALASAGPPISSGYLTHEPAASAAPPSEVVAGEGELPVEFPEVPPLGAIGEAVLAAPERPLLRALSVGTQEQVLTLFPARLRATGPMRSRVEGEDGVSWTLPNALVVPLGPPAAVKPGAVVLTHRPGLPTWARALVVSGGAEGAPRARLLEGRFEEAAPSALPELTLTRGTFRVLSAAWEPGTSVACLVETDGQARARYQVIRVAGEAVLALSYAGELTRLERARCEALAPDAQVSAGEALFAPELGRYVAARVVEADGADAGAPGYARVQREGSNQAWWAPRLDLLRGK